MTNDSASTTQVPAAQIGATTYGFPRIGRRRELKRALESYWSGRADASHLEEVGREVRDDAVAAMRAAGLDSVPVNTFSWYDQVLDTTVMVGAIPERFSGITPAPTAIHGVDPDTYFAMARGTADLAPLEMSKWFDTNYHYLVPEISPDTVFSLDPRKPLAELAEATELNVAARPVVVGPWTYLRLSKAAAGSPEGFAPLDRIWDLVEVYADLLRRLQEAGATWVQLDEPAAVEELSVEEQKVLAEVYQRLGDVQHRPSLFVATYFADPAEALPVLADCPVEAIGVDLTRGADVATMTGTAGLKDKTLVLGAVSGRNIWRTDLRRTLETLVPFMGVARHVAVSSSCSLLHVPYDVEVEQALGADLRSILAFADQKLAEIVTLQRSLSQGVDQAAFAASDRATEARRSLPDLHRPEVQRRVEAVDPTDRQRASRAERRVAQADRLSLPPLPTTTIGSFPQTTEVRKARAERRAGSIDEAAYRDRMRSEIANVISVQDELGLDVLVHGEPERNDMVQYFAEQLDGFATTELGWVQSYGSRCVRPPILFGDVSRPEPMTLDWISYAQGLTSKPVKAMLTGPVTMLTWSFVRDDQGLGVTADQVALALRDEIADLENAGTAIIQVDEPALREGLPLRASERAEYLAWSVASFRLATSGVDVSTQIHTHLCYSEFGEVIDAITDLGADVTSIEAARSHMELLADLTPDSFPGSLGPGVYDIHSPRVPQARELEDLLASALKALPADRLWVNPDCGLKTRKYDEVEPALAHMVQAAADARGRLATA